MSAAQSQTTLESRLDVLQCHFTWGLDISRYDLKNLRDKLEDIGTEEGSWLGHIYNLQGYAQYKLGFPKDALSWFSRASEAFRHVRNADEGPWLVVNYGNLAWLHHYLEEPEESQAYLEKVDNLMNKYPPPSQDELHAEIYAEKAWTLMTFRTDKRSLAADYFQRAIRMQPDMVEWNTTYVTRLVHPSNHSKTGVEPDILEEVRMAKEKDPENLYLAGCYLQLRARNGERIEDEAHELAREVLRNPVSSYNGLRVLLRLYRNHISVDEAIELAEEALAKHPDERYVKRCASNCYRWKILNVRDSRPEQRMIDRAISLHKEVIALYPHTSLFKKIDLANVYTNTRHGQQKGEQIFQELLSQESDLEPADKQLVYNKYAKCAFFQHKDGQKSIKLNMKAAEIPHQSFFREDSIKTLEKIRDRGRDPMCGEIAKFLQNLPQL